MTTRDLPAETKAKAPRTALYLPGTAGNYASAPASSAVQAITGGFDLRWVGSLDDWTPAALNVLMARWSTGTTKSWVLEIGSTAQIILAYSDNGSTTYTIVSSVNIPVADGETIGVRAVWQPNNGAGGRTAWFYTSADEGATWTQLGSPVTVAGTLTTFTSTAPIEIGSDYLGGLYPMKGTVLRAEVRDGTGTVVASPDFTTPTNARMSDAQGNVWTINGSAWAWETA